MRPPVGKNAGANNRNKTHKQSNPRMGLATAIRSTPAVREDSRSTLRTLILTVRITVTILGQPKTMARLD